MNLFTVTVGGIFFLALQYGPMAYPLVGTCIFYPIGLDDSDSSDEQSSHAGNNFCEFLVNLYATSWGQLPVCISIGNNEIVCSIWVKQHYELGIWFKVIQAIASAIWWTKCLFQSAITHTYRKKIYA